MKRMLAYVAGCLLCTALHAQQEQVLDGMAAVVNGRVITRSEVLQYARPALLQLIREHRAQQYPEDELVRRLEAAQADALNTLIDRALIVDEYTEKGYQLPKNILDTQIDETIALDFDHDRRAFIKTLEAEGMTISQYRDRLRERIIVQAMSGKKLEEGAIASPRQIEKYYEDHRDEFREEDKVRLRMIYLAKTDPPEPAPADWEDPALQRAGEIRAELASEESFDSLARKYSEAREADQGGDWGWIERDVLMKELSDVAFSLAPGTHSEVIVAETGYYILFVEDAKPAHLRPLTEVRPMIEKVVQQEQRARIQQEWVQELRARAYIRIF